MSIVEMRVPTIGESITEVTLSQWLVGNGDYVKIDQSICEFESDKATLEFPAEASGIIEWFANEDDDLEIGALVAKIDTSAPEPSGGSQSNESIPTDNKSHSEASSPSKATYATGHASPAAAKLLSEKGMSSDGIIGTGRDGRIIKEDVINLSRPVKAPSKKEGIKPANTTEPIKPKDVFSRNIRREKLSRMRRTIAKRLVSAKNTTAMLTTFNEVDLTEIMKLRKTYQERFVEKNGVKLGFMSLFAKACAKTLIEMPDVNAQLDGDHIIYQDFVDISIAISTPNGLVVPPLKNVESMEFAEIELKIKELAVKARDGSLTLEEMQGGTFTITNGGVFGSMMSTPILNEPQSAILGMHTIQQRPMAINGEVKIRPMMYLALSYDHRVIDGSTSVTFLVKVKKLLEDPTSLLLDL